MSLDLALTGRKPTDNTLTKRLNWTQVIPRPGKLAMLAQTDAIPQVHLWTKASATPAGADDATDATHASGRSKALRYAATTPWQDRLVKSGANL
jgi:hypothetical protein